MQLRLNAGLELGNAFWHFAEAAGGDHPLAKSKAAHYIGWVPPSLCALGGRGGGWVTWRRPVRVLLNFFKSLECLQKEPAL